MKETEMKHWLGIIKLNTVNTDSFKNNFYFISHRLEFYKLNLAPNYMKRTVFILVNVFMIIKV